MWIICGTGGIYVRKMGRGVWWIHPVCMVAVECGLNYCNFCDNSLESPIHTQKGCPDNVYHREVPLLMAKSYYEVLFLVYCFEGGDPLSTMEWLHIINAPIWYVPCMNHACRTMQDGIV